MSRLSFSHGSVWLQPPLLPLLTSQALFLKKAADLSTSRRVNPTQLNS